MALPPSYSSILSDLNRDVLRSQPSDPLQFCANWFNQRLEAERLTLRATQDSVMRDTTPPHSARSLPGEKKGSANKGITTAFGQGYSFGGRKGSDGSMDVEQHGSSSFSDYPSTFGSGASGNRQRGPPAPLNLAPRSAPQGARGDDDSDSDVEDPRDDPNYHPRPTGPASSNGSTGGIPSGYNLGRRTSVSAESLDPNSQQSHLPKTVIPKTASQRARIEASISNNLLFRNLDEDQYKDVLNAMKEVTVNKGTEVIVQGAVGDFFYVVEEGTFEVWLRGPPRHEYAGPGAVTTIPGEEKLVATYGPGGSFGELALMYNAPRAATVVATSRATMWALDRVTFRSILMEHTSRKRKMYESFLGEVPILASLTSQERAKIADALEEKIYDEGEKVVVEGEVGKNFYIIESGKAEVSRRRRSSGGPEEEVLGTLSKGDYFGELALLNSAPRAATVRAMPGEGRLRVATLGEKAFTRLLGPVIDILQRKAVNSYGASATSGQPPPSATRESFASAGQNLIPVEGS